MEENKTVPKWIAVMLEILHDQRDKLRSQLDVLEKEYEEARRACVVPQQLLAKVEDAIQSLGHAAEWAAGTVEEVPL